MSLRDELLAVEDENLKLREVPIPEWGKSVWVRGMTGLERDAFESSLPDGKERTNNFRAKLVVVCSFDEAGNRIFQAGDENVLATKSGSALDRIVTEALLKSGLSQEKAEEAKKD